MMDVPTNRPPAPGETRRLIEHYKSSMVLDPETLEGLRQMSESQQLTVLRLMSKMGIFDKPHITRH